MIFVYFLSISSKMIGFYDRFMIVLREVGMFFRSLLFFHQTSFMRVASSNFKDTSNQSGTKIVLDHRFLLRRLIAKKKVFNIYECVDLQTSRLTIAYVKPVFSYSCRKPLNSTFLNVLRKIYVLK